MSEVSSWLSSAPPDKNRYTLSITSRKLLFTSFYITFHPENLRCVTELLFLMGRPEGRRPLGRPRRRWEDNFKMDLQVVRWGGMDWIDMAQDRDRWRALVSAVMNLQVS
jgi:hypothetical protein